MAKISKTYTIEDETLQIVKENKEYRNLSSDSVSLERIVLEWSILKRNNCDTNNKNTTVDINNIVERVINKLNTEVIIEKEKTDYDHSINDVINEMPE